MIGDPVTCVASASWSAPAIAAFAVAIALVPFVLWLSRAQHFPGQRALIAVHLASIWWVLMTATEILFSSGACKMLASALSHVGIAIVCTGWLFFVIRYTVGTDGVARRFQNWTMIGVPALSGGLALSTTWHGLFYTEASVFIPTETGGYVNYAYGPAFYVITGILYSAILASLALLLQAAIRTSRSGQFRYWLLFFVAAIPTCSSVIYLAFDITLWGYDPTPFTFAFVMVIYVIMLASDTTLDIGALARRQIFEDLPQAIFVITPAGDTRPGNESARSILDWRSSALGGLKPAKSELRFIFDACRKTDQNHCSAREIGDRFFDIDVQPIFPAIGRGQPPLAWIMTADDVTSPVRLQKELEKAANAAEEVAAIDPLTGLLNRRPLQAQFMALLAEATERAEPLHTVLADVDNFKSINDTYGHDVGDVTLKSVADHLKAVFRDTDPLFRFGGEEFLCLIVAMPRDGLLERLTRARTALATAYQTTSDLPGPITFSAGIATFPQDGLTLEQLVKLADRRLFQAKRGGRDQVIWSDIRHSGPVPAAGG